MDGNKVEQQLEPSPHGKKVDRNLSVWSLYVLSVPAWVSSGSYGFLPQSKDIQIRSAA